MQAGSWMGDEMGEKERPRGGLFNQVSPSPSHPLTSSWRETRAKDRRNIGGCVQRCNPWEMAAIQLPSWELWTTAGAVGKETVGRRHLMSVP